MQFKKSVTTGKGCKKKKEISVKLACVASVSNRVIARKLEPSVSNQVIARKLEQKQKKKVEGGGGGEKRKRLPANPTILENAP